MHPGCYQVNSVNLLAVLRLVANFMESQEIANRSSRRKLSSLPDAHKELGFRREFTVEEYNRLARGLIPREMEDKWFIFLEADYLYFHRSWTGFLIYQLRFKEEGDKYLVDEALVNRDSTQYKGTDEEYEVALLGFLIDNLLLGKATPFPIPSGLPNDLPKGLYQHHVSGSGYREVSSKGKEETE